MLYLGAVFLAKCDLYFGMFFVSETVKEIVAQVIMATDWETALGQNAGDNVRQLKAGCRFITLLAQFGSETLTELLVRHSFRNNVNVP